jgi:hypothetical protein
LMCRQHLSAPILKFLTSGPPGNGDHVETKPIRG